MHQLAVRREMLLGPHLPLLARLVAVPGLLQPVAAQGLLGWSRAGIPTLPAEVPAACGVTGCHMIVLNLQLLQPQRLLASPSLAVLPAAASALAAALATGPAQGNVRCMRPSLVMAYGTESTKKDLI